MCIIDIGCNGVMGTVSFIQCWRNSNPKGDRSFGQAVRPLKDGKPQARNVKVPLSSGLGLETT